MRLLMLVLNGQDFGRALKVLSEWYYDRTMRGNQPSVEEIEAYAQKL